MRLLLLTPPLMQPNCPYPATAHLTGFLESLGYDVHQRDLSIKVVIDILKEFGGDEIEELIELLQGSAPFEAKIEASKALEDFALWIQEEYDEDFGFSRYAEKFCASVAGFGSLEKKIRSRGVLDDALENRIAEAISELDPKVVALTCPFPGTLIGAFKTARFIKKNYPDVRLVLGGGFVSSELRNMTDVRVKKYFDDIVYDEGYIPLLSIIDPKRNISETEVPAFVRPSYRGLDMSEYFDVVETSNFVTSLWSAGRWYKLIMARGCYWHKCAFCDVKLPYIASFKMSRATEIVDAMQSLGTLFHFVDEAMPPSLVKGVCEEILRRGFKCEWWGNVRFDTSYTDELVALMAKAGCIAVTGGLECANDRLLSLMNKGITLSTSRKVLQAFKNADIAVHAYLMYAFPTQTEDEAWSSLEYVRGLFNDGLIDSAFWHRFALTVHSPIAMNPQMFGIKVYPLPSKRCKRIFALNEIGYEEPNAPDWERIGKVLELAIANFREGFALDKDISYWKRIEKKL